MTNIIFKYLACFNDAPTYRNWFKYCHMALDRYTYNANRLPFYRDVVYPNIYVCKAPELTPWSQMTDDEYSVVSNDIVSYVNAHPKTYNNYLDICAHLHILTSITRLAPKDDFVLTPFETEFFLWAIAKACMKKSNNKYVFNMHFVRTIQNLL